MPTLKKVADQAGVSKTTASLILNSRQLDQFSDATRQRVVEVARKLQYAPRAQRRAERRHTGKSVAFMLSDKLGSGPGGGGYFGGIIDGIHAAARERGLHVNLATNLASEDDQRRFLREINGDVQGVMAGMALPADVRKELQNRRLPVVRVGDVHLSDEPCFEVYGDNYQGGRLAAKHLIDLGHKRIAFAGFLGELRYFHQRFAGYVDALAQHGLTLRSDLVCGPAKPADLPECLTAMFDRPEAPSAIFAASRDAAQMTVEFLRSHRIQIPEQVSVAGYDDWPITEGMPPAITTVTASAEDIGRLAVSKLLFILDSPTVASHVTLVPPRLLVRHSTCQFQARQAGSSDPTNLS